MRKGLIIAVTILIVVVTVLSYLLDKERKESKRVSDNQTALITGLEHRRTKDSSEIASSFVITLELEEYKRLYSAQCDSIKDMGYNPKRVTSVHDVKSETAIEIEAPIISKPIRVGTDTIVVSCFDFKTKYFDLKGCVIDSVFKGRADIRADIEIIGHRVPKRFWFIKWGTKAVKVDVISKDKKCTITHNRYIELR